MGDLFSRIKFNDSSDEKQLASSVGDSSTPHDLEQGPKETGITGSTGGCPFLGTSSGRIPIHEHQQIIATKKRELTEKEILEHPLYPQRDGEDEKEFGGKITWRNGTKGDYTTANAKYLRERIGRWDSPECLEHVVSNLVKTLEMELTKKSDPRQWVSMAPEVFKYRANGQKWVESQEAVEKGSYNILMQGADDSLYDTTMGFDESHDTFHKAFPGGFALEVLKVYGGPPEVGFTWRHWGTFEGEYNGLKGDGREINIFGFGNAKVRMPTDKDPRIRFTEAEVFYDLDKFLAELNMKDVNPATEDAVVGGTVIKV